MGNVQKVVKRRNLNRKMPLKTNTVFRKDQLICYIPNQLYSYKYSGDIWSFFNKLK